MKTIAVIPARYESSRFPGKPLALINGKPMIQWVYERTIKSYLVDMVLVATDDIRIYNKVVSFNGNVVMTSKNHTCGTERIVEALSKLDQEFEIVLNIQGDEPMIRPEMIKELLIGLEINEVQMVTLKKEITDHNQILNPDVAKVITDEQGNAIYFSRSTIPHNRDGSIVIKYYKHIGMYGYRADFLKFLVNLEPPQLEQLEQLEQLRAIYYGYKIKVLEIFSEVIGVDKPEHIAIVERELNEEKI